MSSSSPQWPGDHENGNPCCIWPRYITGIMRQKGLEKYATDLRGYGIPSHGLPRYLQGFGKNGWRVIEVNGKLDLKASALSQSNEHGSRGYLRVHERAIRRSIQLWEEYKQWLDHIENPARSAAAKTPACSDEAQSTSPSDAQNAAVADQKDEPRKRPGDGGTGARKARRQPPSMPLPRPVPAAAAKK